MLSPCHRDRFRFEFINVDAVIIYLSGGVQFFRSQIHDCIRKHVSLRAPRRCAALFPLILFALHDTQLAVQTFRRSVGSLLRLLIAYWVVKGLDERLKGWVRGNPFRHSKTRPNQS